MIKIGIVVGLAKPDQVVSEILRTSAALTFALPKGADVNIRFCAINAAGLQMMEAGMDFNFWSSWHYYDVVTYAKETGYDKLIITNNNAHDNRIRVHTVKYAGGSSALPAAQMLKINYGCTHVVLCNIRLDGAYESYKRTWQEKVLDLGWCRCFDGPMAALLGQPTTEWFNRLTPFNK